MEKITAPVYFRSNELHRHVQQMRKSLKIRENPYQHGFPPSVNEYFSYSPDHILNRGKKNHINSWIILNQSKGNFRARILSFYFYWTLKGTKRGYCYYVYQQSVKNNKVF